MGIEAKGSSGVYAECPNCHSAIRHGFQVCQSCGHSVSADEQRGLQRILRKNIAIFALIGFVAFASLFYLFSRL